MITRMVLVLSALTCLALLLPGCGDHGESCGPTECKSGQVCCNASCGICVPEGSGAACPQIACGTPDAAAGGGPVCGPATCGAGQVCCDHCTGACVPESSGAFCPDDNDPNRVCADAGAGLADAMP